MPRIIECIVDFESYCKNCKHKDVLQHEEPCNECLDSPMNVESCVPINFKAADNRPKKTVAKSRK